MDRRQTLNNVLQKLDSLAETKENLEGEEADLKNDLFNSKDLYAQSQSHFEEAK